MVASFKPVAFEPHRRRSRRLVPRWLVLLLAGVLIGAVGTVLVQERLLPLRLSTDESTQLLKSLDRASEEAVRLRNELDDTARQLASALDERKSLAEQLAGSTRSTQTLRADIAALIAALPPDPRGGVVEVRAARLAVEGNQLTYDVVLTAADASGEALHALLQFVVNGASGRNADATIELEPIPITVKRYEAVRGNVALPEGFKPRRATIVLLGRDDGKRLGMRIIIVNAK